MKLAAWWTEQSSGPRRISLIAVLIIIAVGLSNLAWGEVNLAERGFIWDSAWFGEVALGFPQNILDGQIFAYHVGRSLPPALVNLGLRVLGHPITGDSVWRGFQVFNLMLLAGSALLWARCLDLLKISATGRWLAFIGLFLNFAQAKLYFYMPIMTDQAALFLGLLLLYAYLQRSHPLMLLVACIGAVSWNFLLLFGLVFYVLTPREVPAPEEPGPAPRKLNNILALAGAAALSGAVLIGFSVQAWQYLEYPREPLRLLYPLSVALLAGYAYFSLRLLLDNDQFYRPAWMIRRLRPWGRLALAVLIYLPFSRIPDWFGAPSSIYFNMPLQSLLGLQAGVLYPGLFLLAPLLAFGPLLMLIAARFPAYVALVHREGPAITLIILLVALMVTLPESRFWVNLLPFVVLMLVRLLEGRRWYAWQLWLITLLQFIASKLYLRFNAPPIAFESALGEFPAQWVQMNNGKFISPENYLLQGTIALIMALILWLALRRQPGAEAPPETRAQRLWPALIALGLMLALPEASSLLRGGTFAVARTPVQTLAAARPIATSELWSFSTPPGSALTLWDGLINEQGYRGVFPARPGPGSAPRLLILEDGLSHDLDEGYRSTPAGRLQARAAAEGRSVEVISAVNRAGEAPDDYLLYLRSEGLRLAPQQIILISHPGDLADLQTHQWSGIDAEGLPTRVQTARDLLDYRTQPLDPDRFWYYRTPLLRQIAPGVALARALTPAPAPLSIEAALDRMLRVIEALAAEADTGGADFTLILLGCQGGPIEATELAGLAADRIGAGRVIDFSVLMDSAPPCDSEGGLTAADEAALAEALYALQAGR